MVLQELCCLRRGQLSQRLNHRALIFTGDGNYTLGMDAPKTFLFAGGGSGGHLFPGIAVAEELRLQHPAVRIVFVGSTRAIESKIFEERDFEHRTTPAEPLPMLKRSPVRFLWRNWQACRTAKRLLEQLQPSAVIGLGGFASAHVVWAASRRRIPVILLEPNLIPGRTTRWLSRFASQVCVSYPEILPRLPFAKRVIVTGNPVRTEIATFNRIENSETSLASHLVRKRELLILGGSQGAESLNEAVLAAVLELQSQFRDWTIVHQTGPRQTDFVRRRYEQMGLIATVEPFFRDLPKRYLTATLVVTRAGATTLAELACVGVPMVLVPFPNAADDHQQANAQMFADQQAAVVVKHAARAETTANSLENTLRDLINNSERRTQMSRAARRLARPDAARQVANVITESIARDSRPATNEP